MCRRTQVILLFALATACKRENKPPPAAASGSAVVIDASAIDAWAIDATTDAPIDAAAQKLAITVSAVGGLKRFEWWKADDDENAKLIQAALSPDLPGIATKFEVMDVPGEVEREEGYWSVRRGDKEIVQVIRRTGDPDTQLPAAMIVWTPEIPTVDGAKVGDTFAATLAKHPDIVCTNEPGQLIAEAVAADVQCQSPKEAPIVYILDANKKKLKTGKLATRSLAEIPIVAIAALPN